MTTVFAHRGFSGKYPENTMLAFQQAATTGCAGIELDVQLTKDGEVIIMHDESIDRTTNGHGLVRDYTLAELKKFTANYTYGDSCPPQTIPTLREYFEFIRTTNLITNIELKTGVFEYEGIEEKVTALVAEYGLKDKIYYSSFNHYSIQRIQKLDPDAFCGLLIDCWIVDIGEYAKKLGAQSVNACSPYLSESIVQELHDVGVQSMAWTPNSREMLTWLTKNKTDVLITNFPDLALEIVAE